MQEDSDLKGSGLKGINTLGSHYNHVPSSSEGNDKIKNSLGILVHSDQMRSKLCKFDRGIGVKPCYAM